MSFDTKGVREVMGKCPGTVSDEEMGDACDEIDSLRQQLAEAQKSELKWCSEMATYKNGHDAVIARAEKAEARVKELLLESEASTMRAEKLEADLEEQKGESDAYEAACIEWKARCEKAEARVEELEEFIQEH